MDDATDRHSARGRAHSLHLILNRGFGGREIAGARSEESTIAHSERHCHQRPPNERHF